MQARLPRDPITEELASETDDLEGGRLAMMRMGPEQAALTTVLVRAIGAQRALEIGTFTGYGSIAIARGLPDDGYLLTCDITEEYSILASRYWERCDVADKIEQRISPALDLMRGLPDDDPFDFVFLDADKEQYPDYYEQCLRLVRPGGLVAIDNVFRRGDVAAEVDEAGVRGIRELNDRIASDERITAQATLSVADGITLVVR